MKWSEFKAAVEAKGIKDDDLIWYINVENRFFNKLEVDKESELGAGITT